MIQKSRRIFTGKLAKGMLSYMFLEQLFISHAFSKKVKPIADHWLFELNEICNDLKTGSIPQKTWQQKIDEFYQTIELGELTQLIDFEKLVNGMSFPDLGVTTARVKFPKVEGVPTQLAFYPKLFGVKKDRAIIPHGHRNMASSHLVLKGEFHLKQYQKIEEESDFLIINLTIDKKEIAGGVSTISDDKNNIHWFKTLSDHAFTFDVIMLDLNNKPYEIHNIDPDGAETMGNGFIRAKKLDVETALKKYGKETHH